MGTVPKATTPVGSTHGSPNPSCPTTPSRGVPRFSSSPQKRQLSGEQASFLGMAVTPSPKKRRIHSSPPPLTSITKDTSCAEEMIPTLDYTIELPPLPPYKAPSPDILAMYQSEMKHIDGYLKRVREQWFAIFLQQVKGIWSVIVVVQDHTKIAHPKSLTGIKVVFCSGDFSFYSGVSGNLPLYERRPPCGASLGGWKLGDQSGTFGGLIRGKTSEDVSGVTAGHLFFDHYSTKLPPPILPPECLEDIFCPSSFELGRILERNESRSLAGNLAPSVQASMSKANAKISDLQEDTSKLLFGDCIGAVWKKYKENGHLRVQDFALIKVEEERIGSNKFQVGGENFFDEFVTGVTGIRQAKVGDKVAVLGMISGCVTGTVVSEGSTNLAALNGEDDCSFTARFIDHDTGRTISKGDSGGWVFDAAGNWLGMNLGGIRAYSDDGIEFCRSVFADSHKILKWAEELLGEPFEVLLYSDPEDE